MRIRLPLVLLVALSAQVGSLAIALPYKPSDLLAPLVTSTFDGMSSDRILASREHASEIQRALSETAHPDSPAIAAALRICGYVERAAVVTESSRTRLTKAQSQSEAMTPGAEDPERFRADRERKDDFFAKAIDREWKASMTVLAGQARMELQRLLVLENSLPQSVLDEFQVGARLVVQRRESNAKKQAENAKAVRLRGQVIATGAGAHIVLCEREAPVADRMARMGGGGIVYFPPSSDISGTFIIRGLGEVADGDLVDVRATPIGIEHGFRTRAGQAYNGSLHSYRMIERVPQ